MVRIVPITGVEIRLAAGNWPLPAEMRAAVPGRWQAMLAQNPHLWDGRILGVTKPVIGDDGIVRAEAREEAYSAFLVWREAGFPEIGIRNMFGSGLIVSSDGALIYGIMGGTTANAGRVYPPAGTLEPRDINAEGMVDIQGSIAIELMEETGLHIDEARRGGMVAVLDEPRISIAQALHFPATAEELLSRIRANLDRQEERELADVVAVRSAADARAAGDPPPYAAALADAIGSGSLRL